VHVAVIAVIASASAAHAEPRAEPRFDASGFFGVDWFGRRTQLGNSWAPEQVPGTSTVFGGRVGWLAMPDLPAHLQLAVEAELGFAPAHTGDEADAGRMSYFAPVIEWRGQAVLRLARWRAIVPHLVLGAGGDSVLSSSPFMAKDTDPIAYWGPGVSATVTGRWQLRLDLRHGIMPARDGGAMSTIELQLGLATSFGAPAARSSTVESAPVAAGDSPAPASSAPAASASPDRLDACVTQPGGNPLADYGCPAADPDGDGIAGDADRCPDQPEDIDGWEDADGCPDPDNDGDGIDDAHDACPDAAETINGWQDEDGCPDEPPVEVTAALATTIRFEPGHAKVTEATAAALLAVREVLDRHPHLRLAIIGHPERAGDDELARRRAEALKWYLVDQGIAEDRFTTSVGPPGSLAITLELAH
jgi:OOP family OmpA-OmpF porin